MNTRVQDQQGQPQTYELQFGGSVLARGFWIYVWEVTTHKDERVYYIGRTGDSSSLNAQSPFGRMGQHLGFVKSSNMLRQWLARRDIEPSRCRYRLVSHGPILQESKELMVHRRRRDVTAAVECALEKRMRAAGYDVLNDVKCRRPLDEGLFETVLEAFGAHFPSLLTSRQTPRSFT
jgi:hypothetical protein